MIGDPSGKTSERVALPEQKVKDNTQLIVENIQRIFMNHEQYFWGNNDKNAKRLKPVKYGTIKFLCSFLFYWIHHEDADNSQTGWSTMLTGTRTSASPISWDQLEGTLGWAAC